MVGKNKYNTFRGIKDRVWQRLYSWKNMLLSKTRKEILLKVVIQDILTYHMSVFIISKRLYKEIYAIMASFWWGHKNNDKKLHRKSWNKTGEAKAIGQLGFRDFKSFNKAMLAK